MKEIKAEGNMDNNAIRKISYGLYVLTAREGSKDNGCIVNTVIQSSSTPNTICVCVNKENYTRDMIMRTGAFTLSIISEEANFGLFKRFGFQSGRDTDKLDGFAEYKRASNGSVYITEGTNAFICVRMIKSVDLGSHTAFFGEITDMGVLNDTPSATYEYYHENIKPKPENAPKGGKTVWRCTVCGYEYVGEELPEDFICPLCKHPASDFEKIVR